MIYCFRFCFLFIFFILDIECSIKGTFKPVGNEVVPGSVLLPASRRGRYLANIIRRQAVDGTGIKFNKDADRMNAESKKKADVLSDEVLPYILAEQERRRTLNRRVMAAVQHGERGVTIAEVRHRSPLIIKRGALYRCPSNRVVLEPDMNGVVLCGPDKSAPKQIVYDSCLAAEDSPLYHTESLFYCNRHRDTAPELPHNGTEPIACHPRQRTSYRQTLTDCSKDTNGDVIVHYRYYPDRTYKYVHELDPDQEICDRFNPCKLGYIFRLATPEMAVRATELFSEQKELEKEFTDEFVPAIAEDSDEEFAPGSGVNVEISTRRIETPPGGKLLRVFMKDVSDEPTQVSPDTYEFKTTCNCLTFKFPKMEASLFGNYYAVYADNGKEQEIRVMKLTQAKTAVRTATATRLPGMSIGNESSAFYSCDGCSLERVVQRNEDGAVNNVGRSNYKHLFTKQTKEHSIHLHYEKLVPEDFGEYFIVVRNPDTTEERVKVITLLMPLEDVNNFIKLEMARIKGKVGGKIDHTVSYDCRACSLTALLCNGHEALSGATIDHDEHTVLFYFPRFHDTQGCVYTGLFKVRGNMYVKTLAVVDNDAEDLAVTTKLDPLNVELDSVVDHTVSFDCGHCKVLEVYVNGQLVPSSLYSISGHNIHFRIGRLQREQVGVYQAIFHVNDKNVTTTLMEIKVGDSNEAQDASTTATAPPKSEAEMTPGADGAPDTTEAGATGPDTTEPDPIESGATQPVTTMADTTKPDTAGAEAE